MSPSRSAATPADLPAQLDRAADALYSLRPDDFAAARDEQVRQARAAGQAVLARELGKLRRPTQSAWLINLLWRDQREVLEQLLQLAAELSRAQAEASGPQLQQFTAQRRELEAALIRRGRSLVEQAGVTVSAAMEREAQETLAAALAQPEVADEVRTGRLVKPATYAGFGPLAASPTPDTVAAAERQPESKSRPGTDELEPRRTRAPKPESRESPRTPEPNVAELQQRRAAQQARDRRLAAERRLADARASLAQAARQVQDVDRTVEAAQLQQTLARQRLEDHQHELRQGEQQLGALERQLGELREQLRQLQQQLRDNQQRRLELEGQLADADQSAHLALRQQAQAHTAHQAALRSVADAEQHLNEHTVE